MYIKFWTILYTGFIFYRPPIHTLSYAKCKQWLRQQEPPFLIYGNTTLFSNHDHIVPMNCEHLVPKSVLKRNKIDKLAQNDLHLLFLSNSRLNSQRQHYRFDILSNATSTVNLDAFGNTCSKQHAHCRKNTKQGVFEPPMERRGVIARTVGYYHFTYGVAGEDVLSYRTMMKWNKQYPVTELEKIRHEHIYQVQQNRNLFVDFPFFLRFIPIHSLYRKHFM